MTTDSETSEKLLVLPYLWVRRRADDHLRGRSEVRQASVTSTASAADFPVV